MDGISSTPTGPPPTLPHSILVGVRWALGIVFVVITLNGCRHPAHDPVTISYFRLGWSQPDELSTAEPLSEQFTHTTGIRLKSIPVPENTLDQLDVSRKLLRDGATDPDVLGVDVIWPAVLADDLIDLRPSLQAELSSLEPQLVATYTVQGKLVAIPYQVQIGVIEYRTDLLREYGYDHPPKTWDELERMAERIQAGERGKGKKDFWGYVWQGAAAEALTCNALEWQIAAGGGHIIEDNGTISVNNPAAIRSWQRAKRWIGWISPPSVVGYREADSINVFDSGRAAFNRVWGGAPGGATVGSIEHSGLIHWRDSLPVGKTGYTSIPGGGSLGGSGLAVSRHSVHPKEAMELVRFLIHSQIQWSKENPAGDLPGQPKPEVYEQPLILAPRDRPEKTSQQNSGVVSRPSSVTGLAYEQVTRAYVDAVHSALTGQRGAAEAAAELEKELIRITGFSAGPPKAAD